MGDWKDRAVFNLHKRQIDELRDAMKAMREDEDDYWSTINLFHEIVVLGIPADRAIERFKGGRTK